MDNGHGAEESKVRGSSGEQEQQQARLNMQPEVFEEVTSRPVEMSQLDKELIISFMDFREQREIKTCPGDIYKIVNALMDYSRMLEMSIEEWGLTGYHQAVYELHAEVLRKIANKFSLGIGYNYYEAVEKCKKRLERQKKHGGSSSDVGEEALALTIQRGRQKKGKEQTSSSEEHKDEQSEVDNSENT